MGNTDASQSNVKTKLDKALKDAENLIHFKDRFELLVNNIEDFVWIMNAELQMIYASPSVFTLLGYTPDEILSNPLTLICTRESAKQLKDAMDKRLTGNSDNTKKEWDITLVHKNGDKLWFETITNPVTDDSDNFIGIIGVSRNVTTRKIIEQQNKEIQANLIAQIENTNDYIWSVDEKYQIKIINSAFKKAFQSAFGVLLEHGNSIIEALPDSLKSIWKIRYDNALAGEHFTVIDELESAFFHTALNPIYVDNEIHGVSCLSRDITEQKRIEQELKFSEKRIKDFVSNIPSVSYQCLADEFWTMQFISNEIENLTAYPASDFIDNKKRTFASVIHPNDYEMVNKEIDRQTAVEESFTIQYRIITRDRKVKWVQEWGRVHKNDKGELQTVDGILVDITQQKSAQLKLEESEDKFKSLNDASVEMMGLASRTETLSFISRFLSEKHPDLTFITTAFNKESCHLELVSINGVHAQLFDPESVSTIQITEQLANYLRDGKFRKIAEMTDLFQVSTETDKLISFFKTRLKNRTLYSVGINRDKMLMGSVWVLTSRNRNFKYKGFLYSFLNLASIILKQQMLLEALNNSEAQFRSIFDNSNAAIAIQTPDKILLVNKAWERITGYTAEEAKQLQPSKLVHPQERDTTMDIARRRVVGGNVPNNYLFHLIDKEANEKWLDLSASLIDYDGKKATLVIASDITTRKKNDLELIKLSTGVINSPTTIVITDIEGNVEYVNPHFMEFTGYTFDEVVGKNPRMWQSGLTAVEVYQDLWGTILSGQVWTGEFQNRKKSGELYWESATIAPIFDKDGIIISFIAIKIDITDRIEAMGMLEKSQKELQDLNAQKDKFFSIIAHDLRSPFSALVGLSSLLKESYGELSDEEIEKFLDLIHQSSENVFKLLENLLTWAKTQTGRMEFKPQKTNLFDVVHESINMVKIAAENKAISIENKIQSDIFLHADKNMLLTILRNLISNAIKYTHKNGLIQVASKTEKYNNKAFAKIWVKDNGVGIPKDKIHKIFKLEENYSTKGTGNEKGSGLGLMLCKDFVKMHHGKIWVESAEGEGSTFLFTIPIK